MKRTIADLAVLGGRPAFTAPLHVGRPNFPPRARFDAFLNQAWDARQLSNQGPLVRLFEERLRARLGAPHCVTVANATLGLMLAARALGFRDEVILPSFTFVATAHALHWQGITPVFCDIDPRTGQLDPADVEARITPRTAGIVAVHLYGRTCEIEALEDLARRRNLKLLVDAAQAVGCSRRGRPVAVHGDAAVFSFHATKVLNSFEGGAVATRDPALAEAVERMSRFGFTGYDRVEGPGLNAKMSEPSAAMGLASLESLDDFIAVNRRNFETYRRVFADLPGVRLVSYAPDSDSNYHYVIAEVDPSTARLSRDALLAVVHAENILARRYFYPGCHRMEPYVSSPPWRGLRLPHTEAVSERILALPTGTAVLERDIEVVGDIVRLALKAGPEFARRMAALPPSRPVGSAPETAS